MATSRATFALPFLAALGLSWWWTHRASDVGAATASTAPTSSPERHPPRPEGDPSSAPPKAASSPPAPEMPTLDKAKRDQMRELIWKAFGQAPPPSAAPSKQRYVLPEHGQMWSEGGSIAKDAEPGIEPEYIQKSVRSQFFPVAQKCYGDALEKTPNLRGEIHLWFVIVGDAKIGGIVESVDVLNKSTLRDPDVIECLRESFLGVTFPPPKGGGAVTVEYPIAFSPEDDDGG